MVRQQQNRHGDVVEYRFLTPANARLIAAAPELLEAARGVDELYSELQAGLPKIANTRAMDIVQEAVRKARAAIAKAEGRAE